MKRPSQPPERCDLCNQQWTTCKGHGRLADAIEAESRKGVRVRFTDDGERVEEALPSAAAVPESGRKPVVRATEEDPWA